MATIKVRMTAGAGGLQPPVHKGDAGFDLRISEPLTLPPGGRATVDCGFEVELPSGFFATVHPRSSLANRGVLAMPTVIDEGYRGPMFVLVLNLSDTEHSFNKGERLAQLILHRLEESYSVQVVEELSESTRGPQGFGSTGA